MPLQIVKKDASTLQVDAVVNVINKKQRGARCTKRTGTGESGQVGLAGVRCLIPPRVGKAKLAYVRQVPFKYVIHTTCPAWRGGERKEGILLRNCYREALRLAVGNQCESVAIPLMTGGPDGYPREEVLEFAVAAVADYLCDHEIKVYLCVSDSTSYQYDEQLYEDISAFMRSPSLGLPHTDKEGVRARSNRIAAKTSLEIDDGSEEKRSPKKKWFPFFRKKAEPYAEDVVGGELRKKETSAAEAAKKLMAAINREQKERFYTEIHSFSLCDETELSDYVRKVEKTFAQQLFDWIDKKKVTEVACYKKANVDRKTFSKIRSDPQNYRPSKQTAVAFAIALELDYEQTQKLLAAAGMTLSDSLPFDKIIRYFIEKGNYDVYAINQALFAFDQVSLGSIE